MILCDYGCGQEAIKQFQNRKWCCSKISIDCNSIKSKRKEKSFASEKKYVRKIKKFECKTCEKKFNSKKSFSFHINKKHNEEDYYRLFLNQQDCGKCKVCSKNTKFMGIHFGYNKYCSTSCSTKDKEWVNRRLETLIKNFGVDNPSKSLFLREKFKKTCISRYGVESPNQVKEIKEKKKLSFLEKYGVDHPSKTFEFRKRSKEYMLNGGAVHAQRFITNPSKGQVETWRITTKICPYVYLNFPVTHLENNYSIDIAIPKLGIAIEYDGSYWHQDKEKDLKRQKELEEDGWKFIRYIDQIPTLEQVKEDIQRIIT